MADGPVCLIPPVQPPPGRDAPLNIPAIPPAAPTIQSLVQTVNTMRQVVHILAGQQGTQGRQGFQGTQGNTGNSAKGTWNEVNRTTEKVKIYQNNDKTSENWVEVEQINSLTMNNKDTGQRWSWRR